MIWRKGAEADIDLIDYLGELSIRKRRVPKGYRIGELDDRLRAGRTRKEARLLSALKDIGLLTPYIYHADFRAGTLVMEYIEGWRLKDFIDRMGEANGTVYHSEKLIETILERIGRDIGIMHGNDITHGDLTTSNMLLYGKDADRLLDLAEIGAPISPADVPVYYIDLSMGEKGAIIENMGEDLDVFFKAFESTHPGLLGHLDHFRRGYGDVFSRHGEVQERLEEIRRRARYR